MMKTESEIRAEFARVISQMKDSQVYNIEKSTKNLYDWFIENKKAIDMKNFMKCLVKKVLS